MSNIQLTRKGLIFNPNNQYLTKKLYEERKLWMNSHAQVPTPIQMGNFVRIFFNTRPEISPSKLYTSQIGYVDLDINNLCKIINISSNPSYLWRENLTNLKYDPKLHFRKDLQEYWIYYTGWTRKSSTPYDWNIGLAISHDGGNNFSR